MAKNDNDLVKANTELTKRGDDEMAQFFVEDAYAAAQEMLKSGGELATQFVKLEDNGPPLRGLFYGFGAPHVMEMVDEKTGEHYERDVKTVIIRAPSGKASVRLLGNYELVQKLAEVPIGSEVLIIRGGRKAVTTQKGPRMVSQFQVVIKRAAESSKLGSLQNAVNLK